MSTDSQENLALSIEASLGQIKQAYPFYSKSNESKFYVAEYISNIEQYANFRIFGTIGLSEYVQYSAKDNRPIQQEFVTILEKGQDCDWIIGIIADIGYRFLSKYNAFCRGDVIGPFGPIDRSTTLSAFYT